ncbi:MAG: hypothetical protein N2319_02680 [Candidatus Kapabacteria bacterium]|nr:hypothetical protein [Candidatus Kapabacteria bacterium]
MEHNFENSYSDLIYLFLDREATPLEQEILFKALSENADLRAEFENALEIYSGFKSDKNNLNPPVHLATSIFASAGMTYPNGYSSSMTNTIAQKSFLSNLKNLFKPAMYLFIGAIITFLSFMFFNSGENSINEASKGIMTNADFERNQFELVSSYFSNNNSKEIITVVRNVPIKNNFEGAFTQSFESENKIIKNESKTVLANNINKSELNLNNNISSNFKFSEELGNNFALLNRNFGKTPALFLTEPSKNPEFYLEIKGNTSLNQFPVNSQNLSINQIYENLGLGLYYKIGKNNLIGVFAGNEPFSIYRVNDPEYINDFTPVSNILTFGGSYRQLIPVFDFNGYLTPFVDVATGFSEFGVITKGAVGLNLNPNNLLNFVVGLDGTMLFYKFKGNIQTTEKISVFFNFGFNL